MRIYMDSCCLNRPFDDQSIDRNRLETAAVLVILDRVQQGHWELIGSEALLYELSGIPDLAKQTGVRQFLDLTSTTVRVDARLEERWDALERLGFSPLDALHIASAESVGCDVLLTVDDTMLTVWRRNRDAAGVPLANPLDWLLAQTDSRDA